jgi:hypothetical protein
MKVYNHTIDRFFNRILFYVLVLAVIYLFYKIEESSHKMPEKEQFQTTVPAQSSPIETVAGS